MSGATATLVCRSCGSDALVDVCSLGDQPLANALPTGPHATGERYPLAVALCTSCGLAQLTVSVDADALFSTYSYFSSYSPSVGVSADRLVRRLISEWELGPTDLAMEAASNDGYLLRHYAAGGVPVLGIDPAANVATAAEAVGVTTVVEFFGTAVAGDLRGQGRLASVFHANNVLAHVPDLNGFVAGIEMVLRDDGVAVVETPYVRELVDRLEYDTIYHEHLCYYSLTALVRLFARHGLDIVDVERIPLHGGSLRLFAMRQGTARVRLSVHAMLDQEQQAGVATAEYFRDFAGRVDSLRRKQRQLLRGLAASGATVAGYGAAAKATVTLNAIGIGAETISFVIDRSPYKQGRYIAGTDVPVLPFEALAHHRPDYLVIFAWNFADEIMAQCADYEADGGRFILPLPDIRMVEPGAHRTGAPDGSSVRAVPDDRLGEASA